MTAEPKGRQGSAAGSELRDAEVSSFVPTLVGQAKDRWGNQLTARLREDVLEALVVGEVATTTGTVEVHTRADDARVADFGDPGFVYVVKVERVARH